VTVRPHAAGSFLRFARRAAARKGLLPAKLPTSKFGSQVVPAGRPVAPHTYTLSQSKKGTASEPAVPMLKNSATALPDEFRTHLTNSRIAGTRDVPEICAANVPRGIVELRVIEDVEEFTSNLEMHCFIEWNHLR
jgi:hypothetical protein